VKAAGNGPLIGGHFFAMVRGLALPRACWS